MEFVDWVENSALGIWMVDSLWAYPGVLATHAVGMSIVVGTILMIDLRVLGYAQAVPLSSLKRLFLVTWIGVVLNLLSGIALFSADPGEFLFHPVFWTKLSLIIIGTLTVYLVWRELRTCMAGETGNAVVSTRGRILAAVSLVLWLCVIIAGRLIAYVEMS